MSYSISVSLQIWHPLLTYEQLQTLFKAIPIAKHSVGENITRKDGKKLLNTYSESYICYSIIEMQNFVEIFDAVKKANCIVSDIIKSKNVFHDLKKTGGRAIYYLSLYTKDHIAFTIPAEISGQLSDLGIELSIEIFQNYID